MKYMVEIEVGTQAGLELERQPGGPGPVMGRMIETFKPEAVYMATTERKIFMLVDLQDDVDVGALMIAASHMAHAYPKFTAVVPAKSFGSVVEKAMQKAEKALGR